MVFDLEAGTVEFIADERRQASLDGYFEKLTADQLAQIQAVTTDMWEPFANSVHAHLADAEDKIVFDRYHLMGYLTKTVDTARKQENRALVAAGDKRLAGSKYLWPSSNENQPARHSRSLQRATRHGPEDRTRVGDQRSPAPLLVLQARRPGRQGTSNAGTSGPPTAG